MKRDNLRDHLHPKASAPKQHYRADHCELRNCPCGNRGKPDIAIQDKGGNPIGYVCQKGYDWHIRAKGLDQHSQWKPTGSQLKQHQHTFDEGRMRTFADLAKEDAFADRYVADEREREANDGH